MKTRNVFCGFGRQASCRKARRVSCGKRSLATVAVLLLTAATAFAQEWRLEVASGIQPLHMGFWHISPSAKVEEQLAEVGQAIDTGKGFYPSVILSGVWHYTERWELVLTGEVCWSHHRLIQYGQFGIDPSGNPRYDLTQHTDIGWKDSSPVASGTLQWRYLWTPWSVVNLYSGVGFGLSGGTHYIPVPCITPIGIRVGGSHIYGFVEAPLGPYAAFLAGGLGWTF